jgi:inner membrane transporter RhtA
VSGAPTGQPGRRVAAIPAWGLVVAGSISLQLGAALAHQLFATLTPPGVAFVRLAVAAVVLSAVLRPSLRRPRRDLALAGAFGVVLGTMNLSFYEALERAPLGVVVTIELLGPMVVALASARRHIVVWAVLALVGTALLSQAALRHLSGITPAGLGFALGAATCWAGYILLGSRVSRRFDSGTGLALGLVAGAVVIAPVGILSAGPALARPALVAEGAVVAIASSVIPYSLEMEALRRISAGLFGLLMSVEPVVAGLVGLVVLGQRLDALDWVAMACVVVACAGAVRAQQAVAPLVP